MKQYLKDCIEIGGLTEREAKLMSSGWGIRARNEELILLQVKADEIKRDEGEETKIIHGLKGLYTLFSKEKNQMVNDDG